MLLTSGSTVANTDTANLIVTIPNPILTVAIAMLGRFSIKMHVQILAA